MAVKQQQEAQNPLILRCNRLIEAFAKSDDERDFYLDRLEGFLIYVDLDKPDEELQVLEKELAKNSDRYCMIPKLTFYETKKIMEGFVNEKVYDIDTKEKLLDIIQSKEARENFLEFIYDHHSELEKWQTYYQERSRIRIIEWLRNNHFHFVFEEDLELPKMLIEKLKRELFQSKAGKDVLAARKALIAKAKTYYSNEALNPRPKRGRPPKQAQKTEIEPQITTDIFTTVPQGLRNFLFTPDLGSPSSATFSSKFGNEEELFSSRRLGSEADLNAISLNQKLAALRSLSDKWLESENAKNKGVANTPEKIVDKSFADDFEEDDEDFDEEPFFQNKPKGLNGFKAAPAKKAPAAAPKAIPKKSNAITPGKKTQSKEAARPVKFISDKSAKPKSSMAAPSKISSKAALKPAAKLPAKGKSIAKLAPKEKQKAPLKPAPKKTSLVAAKPPSKGSSAPQKKKALRPIMKLKKKAKK